MDGKTHGEIIFETWLPSEIREYVEANLAFKMGRPYWRIEKRLLSDSRMKNVWELFQSLPEHQRKQGMVSFLEFSIAARIDGEERKLNSDEMKAIKKLKKRVGDQAKAFINTIREVDIFCSGPETQKQALRSKIDGKQSYETQTREIEEKLMRQLEFYKRNTLPRIHHSIPKAATDDLLTLKKRGQSNFVEVFTREAISIFFEHTLKKKNAAFAEDVASVMEGVANSSGTFATRKHKYDRVRSRRKVSRRRSKQK